MESYSTLLCRVQCERQHHPSENAKKMKPLDHTISALNHASYGSTRRPRLGGGGYLREQKRKARQPIQAQEPHPL
jgi:hypothetical protein